MDSNTSAVGNAASGNLGTSKRILHVDDDRNCLGAVSTALEHAGYVVLSARDATQALILIEGIRLDAIILDLNLDGEDGRELMKFLRHNQPQVPIILFTGLSHEDDAILDMLRDGALQYVRKGPLEDLLKAVGAAVAR